MSSLTRKLWRDLWRMKGQAFAIVLVIASGVSTFIMLMGTMEALNVTRDRFYREYGFAEVFASLKRAPESVGRRIAVIPGVDRIETRVVASVKLDVPGYDEPVTARLVSVPEGGEPLLNRLFIRKGRMVSPGRDDEAVVSEAFADAHRLNPGSTFGAVINGRWKRLTVTGTGLSPEFVLQTRPGSISPDYRRYAIIWMGREALGTAYNMKGAFNDVALTVVRGTNTAELIREIDRVLDRYGSLGAYERNDQLSHRFLEEEFKQLQRSAEIFPTIFIAVAAFLLNVVVTRTVGLEREQIATLKAFGYGNAAVFGHYVLMVIIIVIAGIGCGVGVGLWMGRGLGRIYMEFYRFPYLEYTLGPKVIVAAGAITIASALIGTVHALWKAVSMPPAEAMRPEPPARYRKTIIDRIGVGRLLSQPGRMILRNIERRPVKSFLSVTGISLSCAIMIAGTFSSDAVDFMVDVQFRRSQREDMTVTFTEPTSRKSLYELKGLEGVTHAEVFRSVPVRFRSGTRSYRTSIQGIEPDNALHRPLDIRLRPFRIPPDGVVITDYLGQLLGVREGDTLTAEVLEGKRPVRQVKVAALVTQYIGVLGYMDIAALNRLMDEGRAVSGAYLATDKLHQPGLYRKLIEMPRVAGAVMRREEIRNFYETQAEVLLFFTFISSILAATIAFGVVYNSARIALSERSRELASLRVLGYTRAEISYIFLGELGLLTLAAIPLGFVVGSGICAYIARAISSDLFRVPVVIEPSTYALAAAVVVAAACVSGLIVRHRLDHLDLVAVLKARE